MIELSKTKKPGATGPYIILEKSRNTLRLRHIISHAIIERNGRFCRRLTLEPEVQKSLVTHEEETRKENVIKVPKILAKEQLHLAIDIKEDESENKNQSRYNLRQRKEK